MISRTPILAAALTGIPVISVNLFVAHSTWAEPVTENEALAVADLWYSMELNSPHAKLPRDQRQNRASARSIHRLSYLTASQAVVDAVSPDEDVHAYIVTYDPSGFVVVTGDDRLEPVIAFDVTSQPSLDDVEQNFFLYFLRRRVPLDLECLTHPEARGEPSVSHPNWTRVRRKLQERFDPYTTTFEAQEGAVYVKWDTALWSQGNPYNRTVVAQNGNIPGIPTGCVATAMAIKMRFHEWPQRGSGGHSYRDSWGVVQGYHLVDYSSQTYDWEAMPVTSLTGDTPPVADLMYHCGVGVNMNYEFDGSAASLSSAADAMNTYFGYRGSTLRTIDHEEPAAESIRGGLPVYMGGDGHAVLATGYRTTMSPYFYINTGWNGRCNAWYSLSAFPVDIDDGMCVTGVVARSVPYSQPGNYIYVDGQGGLFEFGMIRLPFETIAQGIYAVPSGGHLWLKSGTYSGEAATVFVIDKPMRIASHQGNARIER